jgi:hypothetical protein
MHERTPSLQVDLQFSNDQDHADGNAGSDGTDASGEDVSDDSNVICFEMVHTRHK